MNLRSVDLNLLTVFDAIMAEGNMTRAAEKIGMSQPAMSLALSRLRHLVDDPLFERQGRGLKPTLRAQELVQPVRRALDIVSNALESTADFDCQASEREFNLVLTDYGEIVLLPRLMAWLKNQHAKININLQPRAQQDFKKDMHFGKLDLYFWHIPLLDDEIISERLGSFSHSCLVREDHPLINDSINLEQYCQLQHITFHAPGENTSIIDQQIRGAGMERQVGMRIHTYFDVPRVLTATDMICTLPTPIAHSFAEIHKLKVLALPMDNVEMPLYMMWHRNQDNDEVHKWLRNFLITLCARI